MARSRARPSRATAHPASSLPDYVRPLNTWGRDVVNTMLPPVEQVAISRLIGYLYSAASLSADRNPVWYTMSVGSIASRHMPSL